MLKSFVEDILFLIVISALAYWTWNKWLGTWLTAGLAAAGKTAAAYKADVSTIAGAVKNPIDTVNDLFKSGTPYISQADFKNNIEEIKRNLQGKQ